ncbi:hypothetical protein OAT08_03250 [Pelagibacteraceae bacterium]|jgi:hypothetical protein|nr:hypothetical protein [Pelagibacteraceae bacterium]
MRDYIVKIFILMIALYILFKITIGSVINTYFSKIEKLTNQKNRIEIKEKILLELKKGTEKENLFNSEEKIIISNFINKIIRELNISSSK